MSFDPDALGAALTAHGRVARVVIAAVDGSSPREVGASMLVWPDHTKNGGQSGTIGGGALEFAAVARARTAQGRVVERVALGPSLGQCCGGAVVLWTEVFEAVPVPVAGVVARGPGEMPLAVRRVLAAARGQGVRPAPGLVQGWLVEPVAAPVRQVWVWGAGHVGRALVAVLAPLPGLAVTWVDVAEERFPQEIAAGVTRVPVADPAALAVHAPVAAEHLIVTFSHALDLDLCHRLLGRGFAACGLIGSATKWARFRSRLAALGHTPEAIARIRCPIGDPGFGKHPQAIAVGVAAGMLRQGVVARGEKRA
ncbi:MAG: xanthine dehydrogenase accessory protein XdhC [Rhodobacter sp.]|nr:xanthine dehydrogenase accessory protein XdhC [Rhodobacter sp.]